MRSFLAPLYIIFILNSMLFAQQFILLGGGYSAIFYNSEGLDEFRSTYNIYNQRFLLQPLDGIDNGLGLHMEFGYRSVANLHMAFCVGYISHLEEDLAKFSNGERRRNKFESSFMYLDYETGVGIENFFVNGLIRISFNRKSELSTWYLSLNGESIPTPLSGVYTSSVTMAADIGISAGLYRHPFFLVAKITLPVVTGGSDEVLTDNRQSKQEEGTSRFPRNYADLFSKEPYYRAVSSDIDGIKISILLSYAIRFD